MSETIPVKIIADTLSQEWQETSAGTLPKPHLLDIGADGRTIRVDLDRFLTPPQAGTGTPGKRDLIVIRPDTPTLEETPIGNWAYGNRLTQVSLELYSNVGRQRIYDLMAEVRRICHKKMHTTVGYQRIRFASWQEETEESFMIWMGKVIIVLENYAILLET